MGAIIAIIKAIIVVALGDQYDHLRLVVTGFDQCNYIFGLHCPTARKSTEIG